jgi:hypothetical protein
MIQRGFGRYLIATLAKKIHVVSLVGTHRDAMNTVRGV